MAGCCLCYWRQKQKLLAFLCGPESGELLVYKCLVSERLNKIHSPRLQNRVVQLRPAHSASGLKEKCVITFESRSETDRGVLLFH